MPGCTCARRTEVGDSGGHVRSSAVCDRQEAETPQAAAHGRSDVQNGVHHAMLTQPLADPRVGWECSRPLPPTPRPRHVLLATPERARVTQPPAPRPCSALPDSRGLRPHLFPAAECPLVVTSEVFEDSEEETGIGWTPRSRARGQGGCLRTKTCCPREPRGGQGQEAR